LQASQRSIEFTVREKPFRSLSEFESLLAANIRSGLTRCSVRYGRCGHTTGAATDEERRNERASAFYGEYA
jgi:hypothetical protein